MRGRDVSLGAQRHDVFDEECQKRHDYSDGEDEKGAAQVLQIEFSQFLGGFLLAFGAPADIGGVFVVDVVDDDAALGNVEQPSGR